MLNNKFLRMSDKASNEYCCCVVRIEELKPIECSDFLATTIINGNTQIVVRKDQVHEGDIMFYAMNETQLNSKFLSANNLYDISNYEMNSNKDEVALIMNDYESNYKNVAKPLKNKAQTYKKTINGLQKNIKFIKKDINKLQKNLNDGNPNVELLNEEISKLSNLCDEKEANILSLTTKLAKVKQESEEIIKSGKHLVDGAKKKVGFFNQYGRVRCIMLQGEYSFGFLFSKEEMARYNPKINKINLEDYIDQNFDTVDDETFVSVYVPPIKEVNVKPRGDGKYNTQKKFNHFDKLLKGEFMFHYDTTPLDLRTIRMFKPDDIVTISVKVHGTSAIEAKVKVKCRYDKNHWRVKWNNFINKCHLPKLLLVRDYYKKYGPVFTSRGVVKNEEANPNAKPGYNPHDSYYNEWGEALYPYLEEGMTVYGEIVGYSTGRDTMVQKFYDYGCQKGENKFMPYRITTTKKDGTKYEWNVIDVQKWTKELIDTHPEFKGKLEPIHIVYYGPFKDLYPLIKVDDDWYRNVLSEMTKDTECFGMEEREPLCINDVPREGVCIRKDNDTIKECFKLKTMAFKYKEAIDIDNNEVDAEMAENPEYNKNI